MVVNPLLRDDDFQTKHSRDLFDAIDRLRSCGANRDLELPELVIVGDQSAGKSSLLQSLTDIPFPVANNVCTRFPTRIVSRRDPGPRETTTTVSIERNMESPNMDSRFGDILDQRYEEMDEFTHSFTTMTKADFARVIEGATEVLGICRATSAEENSTPSDTTQKRNFSDHELKIEISGPDRAHFSILDVPGIFQALTRGLTKADRTSVVSMVSNYMESEQSIIICVASGTNDISNQAIFDMVEEWDPEGERTVGVITKCDVDDQMKQTIVEYAENKVKPLHHGWFVVRNRTLSEVEEGIGPTERSSREQEFFNRWPWNQLPEERRGAEALKKYLAKLLCDRIEKVFPTILSDIRARLARTAVELEALELPRKSVEQKRAYLTRIAHDLNQLATQGLRGRYDRIAGHDMKLRMKVRDANDSFASEMNRNGHFLAFSLGPFGLNAQAGKVRPHRPAAQSIPFQAHIERDTQGMVSSFQSISSMGPYKDDSFEELRLSHYSQAQPPPLPEPSTSAPRSIFGAPTSKNLTKTVYLGQDSGGSESFGSATSTPPSMTNPFGQTSSPFATFGNPSSTSQSKTNTTGQNSGGPFASLGTPSSTSQSKTNTTGQTSGGFFGSLGNPSSTSQSKTQTTGQDSGSPFATFGNPSSTSQSKTNTTGQDSGSPFATFGNPSSTSQSKTNTTGQDSGNLFASLGTPSSTSQRKTNTTGQTSGGFFGSLGNPSSTSQSKNQTTGQDSGNLFASLGTPSSTSQSKTNTTGQTSGGFSGSLGNPSSTSQSKTQTTGQDSVLPFASHSPSPSRRNQVIQEEHNEIYGWIRNEIKTSRGTELQGTMNPDVLPILFHKQAGNWRSMSESHFKNVSTIAHIATSQALDAVCKDPLTRKKIMSRISEVTVRSKDRFLASLSQRVDDILSRHLQTNNPAFEQKVSEARKRRFHAALERYKSSRPHQSKALTSNESGDDGNRLVIDMRDVDALFAELHMSNSQNLEDEVHDTLKAYYEIARDDFIEYVTQLIVEPYLSDPEGPVLFFSPVYVAGLKDEDIQSLGREDETNVRKRAEKEETLARLSRAEQIAREYE